MSFQSTLTTWVVQWRQRNPSKSALQVKSFCFAYFLVSVVIVVRWAPLGALPRKTIFDMGRFRLKNWRFDENRASKSTSAGTHTEAQRRDFSEECWIGVREGKEGKWKRKPFSDPVPSPRKSQWKKCLPPQNSPMVHPNTTSTQFHVQYPAGIFGIFFMESRNPDCPEKKGGKEQ